MPPQLASSGQMVSCCLCARGEIRITAIINLFRVFLSKNQRKDTLE